MVVVREKEEIADLFGLICSLPVLPVPTHYLDTNGYANSVIDLIFLGLSSTQVSYHIKSDLRQPSDHALLLVNLLISPENTCLRKKVLKHSSEKKDTFLSSITIELQALNFSGLNSVVGLDSISKAISKVLSNANARTITVTS